MSILFMSLVDMPSIDVRGLYSDLLREIAGRGHCIYCVSPTESLEGESARLVEQDNAVILRLKTGRIQKTNFIKKGINTLMLEPRIIRAVKRYFRDIEFDLVLYPTPPVTFAKVVKYVKKRDGASSYLMLKDIFPQGAVDIGIIKPGSLIHRFFREKEKSLYEGADYIGCMSQANVKYLTSHNPGIDPAKVEICPNSADPAPPVTGDKREFKLKRGIPEEAVVFLYGGNLGKPQDIGFIVKCLDINKNQNDRFFIICGDGTDFHILKEFIDREKPRNVILSRGLPREEYDRIKSCCDVGLIFLDHRFTIPNFPSRLLSYLESVMPVLACTDNATDIGEVIVKNGFGWRCESREPKNFTAVIDKIAAERDKLAEIGLTGREYFERFYTSAASADVILKHFEKR
jgi:glycosyltransferase involved in cell wall biosynthesis